MFQSKYAAKVAAQSGPVLDVADCRELRDEFDTDWRAVAREFLEGSDDFAVDMYGGEFRFISESIIDDVQQDELAGDEYSLGCFVAWLLADVLEIDVELVEALQSAEKYEALGRSVINKPSALADLQDAYKSADGYGHHFATYDGHEHSTYIGDRHFYFFRVN